MLERIKWLLWHGNSHQAEQAIEAFEADFDALEVDYANLGKLVRAAHEFAGYIRHNTASALDGTLRPLFERWYPGLTADNQAYVCRAAA